jgi:spore maturation protein SpmB
VLWCVESSDLAIYCCIRISGFLSCVADALPAVFRIDGLRTPELSVACSLYLLGVAALNSCEPTNPEHHFRLKTLNP